MKDRNAEYVIGVEAQNAESGPNSQFPLISRGVCES
jgi:hypothetical protein